ncbi:MAG: cupin domain-containing protein [Actinomycetota bacterium]
MRATQLVTRGTFGVLELLGPTVEFLTPPSEAAYCVLLGTLPPGVSVPLHSHPDDESFYLLSGAVQALTQQGEQLEWLEVPTGGFLHIPGGAKHAFRNPSTEPAVQLVTTTRALGRFFQEIGRPISPGETAPPPTPADLQRFAEAAARRGHWLGSPAENAAVGIILPD